MHIVKRSIFDEIWAQIPKYSITRQEQDSLREEDGSLPIRRFTYTSDSGDVFDVTISPASILFNDQEIDVYPAENEQYVEQAINQIKAEVKGGMAGITAEAIHRRLLKSSRIMSVDAIIQSIEIMMQANMTIDHLDDEGKSVACLDRRFF